VSSTVANPYSESNLAAHTKPTEHTFLTWSTPMSELNSHTCPTHTQSVHQSTNATAAPPHSGGKKKKAKIKHSLHSDNIQCQWVNSATFHLNDVETSNKVQQRGQEKNAKGVGWGRTIQDMTSVWIMDCVLVFQNFT